MSYLNKDERRYLIQTLLLGGFAIGIGGWALFSGNALAAVGGICGLLFAGMLLYETLE